MSPLSLGSAALVRARLCFSPELVHWGFWEFYIKSPHTYFIFCLHMHISFYIRMWRQKHMLTHTLCKYSIFIQLNIYSQLCPKAWNINNKATC